MNASETVHEKHENDISLSKALDILSLKHDLIKPVSKGRLQRLRTLAEVQSSLKLEDVYIVRVPNKSANHILK